MYFNKKQKLFIKNMYFPFILYCRFDLWVSELNSMEVWVVKFKVSIFCSNFFSIVFLAREIHHYFYMFSILTTFYIKLNYVDGNGKAWIASFVNVENHRYIKWNVIFMPLFKSPWWKFPKYENGFNEIFIIIV